MATDGNKPSDLTPFLKSKGFDDKSIQELFKKCKALHHADSENAAANWDYLTTIGIQERKLPRVISKCPKILTLHHEDRLVPTVQCLLTLGSKPGDVGAAVAKFPNILCHSVDEKLCPLLAFFQSLGIPDKQIGKLLLLNPRLVSYSIETKFSTVVEFLASLGFNKGEHIDESFYEILGERSTLFTECLSGKILNKDPFIVGYSVEKRLKPTTEFLKSIGLGEQEIRRVVLNFPEVLSRDVNKILRPNLAFLRRRGFSNGEITALVSGYAPILIKSVKNSLEPKINFLVEQMGRQMGEAAEYPEFFKHGLKKSLEFRQKVLKERNMNCSLSEMLGCNQKKFAAKYGLVAGIC